ncbi:MAG TPA: lipopolysaccharide assembly protein LapA domain-containing protein [Candidatus Dormibacteraeota bacterium]|nr:lipopolysaccharide assembly protein LapA domain-containing protein [Candidatus Dormibacteraeota bacterium]
MSAAQAARARAGVVGGVITLIIMLVLAVQNTGGVAVHFLLWGWAGTPLFAVIVVSMLLGFLLGLAFMVSQPRLADASATPATRPRRRTVRGKRAAAEPVAGPPAEL